MERKVRWGIMGTGRIAGTFSDMLKELEGAEIYAVASRTEEKSRDFGQRYGAEKCYGSYEALVRDEQVDVIYVATAIGCHYENVKLCLNGGKHVLCEKALTRTVAEAEELDALAKEKNCFLMEALWTRCQPVFRKIMEWKTEGKFGEIQGVEAKFYTCATREHRLMKNRSQGGSLFDLVIYPLVYACALLGYEPQKINAIAVKDGDHVDVMESIQLQYENGSFASLTGGLSCERQESLYIHGTKGRVLIHQENFHKAQRAVLYDWNNEVVEDFEGTFLVNGYEYEAMEAMDCIRRGRTESGMVPMKETIAVIRIMEECSRQWDH